MKKNSQSREHIAKRIAAITRTRANWSEDKQKAVKERLRKAWAEKPGSRWKPGQLEKTLATKSERRAAGLYKKRKPASEETKAKIRATKLARKSLNNPIDQAGPLHP